MKQRQFKLNKLVSAFAVAVALLVMCITARTSLIETISLEQELRCGKTEHIHTDECYEDDVLSCKKAEHVHERSCFLVLLDDNDIHTVLEETNRVEERTLEAVIETTLDTALTYNKDLIDGEENKKLIETIRGREDEQLIENISDDGEDMLENTRVSAINLDSIRIREINKLLHSVESLPSMVFNETLVTTEEPDITFSADEEDNDITLEYIPNGSNAVRSQYAALGGTPSTQKGKVNLYIYLDDEWTYLSTFDATTYRSSYYMSASEINSALKKLDGNTYTTANYKATYYSGSGPNPTNPWDYKDASFSNGSANIGGSNAKNAFYIRLLEPKGDYTKPLKFYTVTFIAKDGTKTTQVYKSGNKISFDTNALKGTTWVMDGTNEEYTGKSSYTVTSAVTFRAKMDYTVTFEYPDGTKVTQGYNKNAVINFADENLKDYVWVYGTKEYSEGTSDSTLTVTSNMTVKAKPAFEVRFIYPDDTPDLVKTFYKPTTIHFSDPALNDYIWKDGSIPYTGTDTLTVTGALTLRGEKNGPMQNCTITYDINFPSVDSVTVATADVPKIDANGRSTYSYITTPTDITSVVGVTNQGVYGAVNSDSTGRHRPIMFRGWKVEGAQANGKDVILKPGATLGWDSIVQYADSSQSIKLTGVWEQSIKETVSFFIRFDSAAVDINGNVASRDANLYTPELFCTFLENIDTNMSVSQLQNTYGIADTTADNSYAADRAIRELAAVRDDYPYMISFPDDDDMFDLLKAYTKATQAAGTTQYLTVDGEVVLDENLNSNGYAIRWYVFKSQNDAWHVDGKLVRKEGELEVTKSFTGNKTAIEAVKNSGYSITVNGSRLGQKTLSLADASYDAATDIYKWRVDNLTYDEAITITENNYRPPDDYLVYAEYNVQDASGSQSEDGMVQTLSSGTITGLKGRTYAIDTGLHEVMSVNIVNAYYHKDSILLKKVDATTGNAIQGAEFEIRQLLKFSPMDLLPVALSDPPEADAEPSEPENRASSAYQSPADNTVEEAQTDSVSAAIQKQMLASEPEEVELLLTFTQDPVTGSYAYSEDGTITRLTANKGFYEIQIDGISFEAGDLKIDEVVVPDGYTAAGSIRVAKEDGRIVTVPANAATVTDNVLFISNTSETIENLYAEKVWSCDESKWKPVTIQLQANGRNALALFPTLKNTTVVLDASNNWQCAWHDLPKYANGGLVEWSIRETRVGTEKIRDNDSFLNYIVSYSNFTDIDGAKHLVVTNDIRRTMLRVTKTDWDGTRGLAGATYQLRRLIQDDGDGIYKVDASFIPLRQTSGKDGVMVFEGIQYGRYLLSEVEAPAGFYSGEPVELEIKENGEVVIISGRDYAQFNDVEFNITVRDLDQEVLPATGGMSAWIMQAIGGISLMLMLVLGLGIHKKRWGETR